MSSDYLSCISSGFATHCATSSQFTPFGGARMKDVLPFGVCLPSNTNTYASESHSSPLPFHRRCALDSGVPPLASPNASATLREYSLKWIPLTIYSTFAPLRGCKVRKLSAVSVRVTPSSTDILLMPLSVMTRTIAFPRFVTPGYRMIYGRTPQPPTSSSPPDFRRL
jgi:hypothetical protein